MAKRKISHKGARQKGLSFEREVAIALRRVFPNARRHLEFQTSQAYGVDIDETGIFRIQCKRGRRYASLSKIAEVQTCPIEGHIPVLVTRGDDTDALAALPLSDFIELLRLAGIK